MSVDELLPQVLLIVTVWVTLAFGAVTVVRLLYRRSVERLMHGQRSDQTPAVEVMHPEWVPPVVWRNVAQYLAGDCFAPRHRLRLLLFCVGSVVYALSFGVAWMFKIALEDSSFRITWAMVTSFDVLLSASKFAFLPIIPTLLLLNVRKFQYQASGVWTAALILIALPMGRLTLHMSAIDWAIVPLRAALGVGAAIAYLRFNAWRAENSRWSFPARGLHAFFATFSLAFFVFAGLGGHWRTGALFLLPYPAYLLSLRLMFACVRRRPNPRLLYLRVFGRAAQTDRFYRELAHDWSTLGPVRLIGASDLAPRTMSPELLTAFVNGNLREAFQWTEQGLAARVTRADRALLDLTYRTVEMLCAGETWREAVRQLARDADVVVMDLRGFQQTNAGCAWEIGQLVNSTPLRKVLLCVDRATNPAELSQALLRAWRSVRPESPNWHLLDPFQILDVSQARERVSLHAHALSSANESIEVDRLRNAGRVEAGSPNLV